ncbi:hypothetical protein D9M69_385550 [compost metagenome]
MIVIHALDAEALAQVGGAFLVADFLGPVVLLPVVGRHVEQAGVLAVGHGVPVLAAEEGRRDFHRLALLLPRLGQRRALALVLHRAAGLQVDVAGPGDVVDEGEGVLQLAVAAVHHVEEAVAVGVGGGLDGLAVLALVVEQHQFVVAGEVPGIVGGVLVEPLHFAGARVHADLAGGVEAVEVLRVATFGGTRPAVPRGRVAGADDDGVGFRVEAGALPGGAAAVAPGFLLAGGGVLVVGPGRGLDVAGGRAVLAVQAAHVAFDEGPHPHLFAGVRVAGVELADHAELIAGTAVDQQHLAALAVLHDGRRTGHGVTRAVVAKFLVPDHLAGLLVEGDHAGVQGAEEDLVAVDGRATVDHVAAGADVVGQAVVVGPQALAGPGVEGEHAGIGSGDVDHPVADDGLGFLAALLLVAEGEGPGRGQLEHVVGVDLGQRAPALGVGAHAVLQDVAGGLVVVGDVVPADVLGQGARGCGQSAEQQQGADGVGQRAGRAG